MATIALRSPEQPLRSNAGQIALCLAAVYIIWGSTYLAIRIAVATLPPFLMAGTRFLIAGAILFCYLRWRDARNSSREPLPTPRQWFHCTIIGGLLLGVSNGAVVFAEQYVSSGLASVVVATCPLWIGIFSGLLGTWPERREWLGIGIGLLGILWLNSGGELRANSVGAGALMIAPITWALGSVLSARLDLPKGMMAAAVEMIAGGALLLVASLVCSEDLSAPIRTSSVLAWVYLIVVGSLIGFSAFMYLIRNVRPALATSYAYVNPIVALSLGAAAGEKISAREFIAIAVALLGVVLIALVKQSNPGAAALKEG